MPNTIGLQIPPKTGTLVSSASGLHLRRKRHSTIMPKKTRSHRNRTVKLVLDDHVEQTPFVMSKVPELRTWKGTERELVEEAAAATGVAVDDIIRAGARIEAQRLLANAKANELLPADGDTRGRRGVRDAAFEEAFQRLLKEFAKTGELITPSRLNKTAGLNLFRSAKQFLTLHYPTHPAVRLSPEAAK